ncbi:hypothetical protein K435DRAFT_933946 [Dendrothele bispora CBS 962.96]|uniref:CxC1-like cysteine cluster associated with KDZ transposases domain-containing protein n=1 Tax=Dendrothele bispora (strain CBS 962.96) TaxID=1314807 RepID=A0A4S8L284_DENBC|nr:hypothetical protein K435DRAFT_933946 [Dendrothele bispora CBS 962.96]
MPANDRRDDENEDSNVTVFNASIAQKDGATSRTRSSREKKEEQAQNWLRKVIPSLLHPYMELLRESESLRIAPTLKVDERCSCIRAHELKLVIVRFDSSLTVPCCTDSTPVATQLLRSGLFPCAPYCPTLAVDVRMLDFVARLYLRIAPNHTAWCSALEDFLGAQGYRLIGTDPLRRRFSNALQWFISLQHMTTKYVKDHVTKVGRRESQEYTQDDPGNETDRADIQSRPARTNSAVANRYSREDQSTTPTLSTSALSGVPRASGYLRSRCPLCFGGTTNPNTPTVLVCVDACFTQKHNDQHGKDPRRVHPDTFFIPPEKVKEMEDLVESIRQSGEKKRRKQQDNDEDDNDDFMEPGMNIPKSALDGCNTSFTASDEGRSKSRAKGYDERALAGMFCPHGNSLFMVTMTSLGEKQHYILVLLQALFEQIPTKWTVGFLYDVACQLKRSCLKWGFLSSYIDRIVWGVSVFHAYGHQWPCQLIYHPRKCKGFGFCDGETCERCWHALSRLIAYTRVAGYYVRLYTLDAQLNFNNQQALLNAGKWLQRKLQLCIQRHQNTQQEFNEAGISLEVAREQWKLQVTLQTKPLPTQRKNAAKKAVEETLRLQKAVEVLKLRRKDLEDVLTSSSSSTYQQAMAVDDLEKAKESLQKAQEKLGRHERSLGIQERTQVKKLTKSPFLTKRMNARALKMRLWERLRARKFELDRLERSFRKQHSVHSEQQLNEHTRDSIRRREPGISAIATKYNKLCDEMATLIRQKKAPKFAVAPKKIERDTLFDLDVDEDIWQDVGLDEEDAGPPPPWLCDEKVRKAIRAMLELDRCEEEMSRIRINRRALQEWFVDEWEVLKNVVVNTSNQGMSYLLELRRRYLLKLCIMWERPLSQVSQGCSGHWGPSMEELAEARVEEMTSAVEDLDINVFEVDFEEGMDANLITELDTIDVVDGFRGVIDD